MKEGTANAGDKDQKILFHCGAGLRSLLAVTIAERMGFTNVTNLAGGFNKIKSNNIPTTEMTQTPVITL